MSKYRSKVERALEQLLDSHDDTVKLKAALALERIAERKRKRKTETALVDPNRDYYEILAKL